jgi:hypothetical protein
MTFSGKSIAIALTGLLVTASAVALPLLPAFGEGGARRDVVLRSVVDTLYLVEFEATQAGTPTSREQRIEQLEKLVIPTIESLGKDSKVRAGGIAADTLVRALPAQGIMQWKVTPLETFAKRADIEKKVVQRLRTQK